MDRATSVAGDSGGRRWSSPWSGDRSGGDAHVFWRGGALDDLYEATIVYNLQYSGETYASRWDMIRYLFVAPIRHAQVDPLWFVGGVGCVFMLTRLPARARPAQAGDWMDSRPLGRARVRVDRDQRQPRSAAVLPPGRAGARAGGRDGGGDRGLAATARRGGAVRSSSCCSPSRHGASAPIPFPSSPATSGTTRSTPLGRIDRRDRTWRSTARATCDKYSALDNRDLGDFLERTRRRTDTVFIFGFSSGAYVYADRRSASRFFWSRPVIVDFNGGDPGYGVNGLRADLELRKPAVHRPPGARLAGLAELGAVLPVAAAPRGLAARPLSPAGRFLEGFQGWSGTPLDSDRGESPAVARDRPMTNRRFWLSLTAIVLLAIALRGLFPAADPPWRSTVGVVWHDEGAWIHNARNKALFGDVAAGRVEPGVHRPGLHGAGVRVVRGVRRRRAAGAPGQRGRRRALGDPAGAGHPPPRRAIGAGLIAAALLATNYVYVMYNRAAIMEALMAAFIVASWYCSTRAEQSPRWGALAGVMATLAFFTKAAAAFYVGALGLAALMRIAEGRWVGSSA